MVHIDKYEFEVKCRDVMKDIEKGEATSTAWLWMVFGAALGLISSCIKFKPSSGKPILIARRKVKNGID